MNFTKNIIIGILFLYCTNMNSQTTSSYLNTNIQQHILNKYWSNELATTGKTVVFFGKNFFSSYINKKKFGNTYYYFTNESCNDPATVYKNSTVGIISSGNYIKTERHCYLIEISSDFKQIRMKKSHENKWQTFYLLDNPDLEY